MITGAILEKGETGYTYLKKLFRLMDNFQNDYNWLITGCEAYPERSGHRMRIFQSKHGNYAWIDGKELTNIVKKDDFQWIWGVLSGFEKDVSKIDILKYGLPYADGYRGFWEEHIAMQHPLASVELVSWDGSLTLLMSEKTAIIKKFKEVFPLSEDLKEYNRKNAGRAELFNRRMEDEDDYRRRNGCKRI